MIEKRENFRFLDVKHFSTYQYLLLGLIILVAAALRFYKLGEWSFWIDEAWSIRDSLAITIPTGIFSGNFKFLFYLLLRPVLDALGVSEWSARLLPALVGIISIPIIYTIVKKMFSVPVALLAASLLAVSPWHLYWSQNARFYTLLLLLYTLSLFAFHWGIEKDQLKYLIASMVLWSLALVTHPLAALVIPTLALYLILVRMLPFDKPLGLRLRYFILLVLMPLIYVFYETYRVVVLGYNSMISKIISIFFVGGQGFHGLRVLVGVGYYIGIPLIALALVGGLYMLLERNRVGLLLLIGVFVPLATIVLISPFSVVHKRYVFMTLPLWAILGATAVTGIFTQTGKHGKVLALGVLILLLADPISQDWLYFNHQHGNRWNWKDAFQVVQQRKIAEDLVVTTWPELGNYYLGEEVIAMYETNPEIVVQSDKRTWFVDDNWVNLPLARWLQKNAELIDTHHVTMPGKTYEMRVYLYDPAKHRLDSPAFQPSAENSRQ